MRFGIVGLGRMGSNVARQAIEKGHQVVGFNDDEAPTKELATEGLDPAFSLEELVAKLQRPRVVMLYVPHGSPTEDVCRSLARMLSSADVVVDGGNSHWEDSKRRNQALNRHGVFLLDAGTSGGLAGARSGACFMVGGDPGAFDLVAPLLRDLAVDDAAVVRVGPAGAGHFAKLVHNAIEFGMVQSIAEGVELLHRAEYGFDVPAVLESWNHGSVIRSWLVELMAASLRDHESLNELSTYVEDTGEVKWILQWSMDQDIPTPVIDQAQTAVMAYRDIDSIQAKAVALVRHAFGGHPVHRQESPSAQGTAARRTAAGQ